ncbi:unnamed protein product [Arctia plantaginis]|uniref:Uncharacterized protein n=1 Tax=Arctia plantaginis TaxID=874455 RepID=A0A8S0ZQ00_ARCPL|nr:unnamed protein product [Arctia plantaginis]
MVHATSVTKGKHGDDKTLLVEKGHSKSHSNSKGLETKHNIFSKLIYNIEKVEVDSTNHSKKLRKPIVAKKPIVKKSEIKHRIEKPIYPQKRHQEKQDYEHKKSQDTSNNSRNSHKEKSSVDKQLKQNEGSSVRYPKIIQAIKLKRNHESIDITQNEKRPMMSRIVKAIEVRRHHGKIDENRVEEVPMMTRIAKAIEIKRHRNKVEAKEVEERPLRSRIVRAMEIKRNHEQIEEKPKQIHDRPMIHRIVNRASYLAMDIKPSFHFHDKTENESNHSPEKSRIPSKNNVEYNLSTKIWQVLSHDLFNSSDDDGDDKFKATDSEMKNHILSVVRKYNKKEIDKNSQFCDETQTREHPSSSSASKKKMKQAVKRQLWQWAKNAIKNNEHWSKLFAENHIMLDNINIDKLDLSLIDLEALGIENKMLKRTIVWLFK